MDTLAVLEKLRLDVEQARQERDELLAAGQALIPWAGVGVEGHLNAGTGQRILNEAASVIDRIAKAAAPANT